MKTHWTARSIKDYLFRIASDFVTQLENRMESLPISQDELAKKLGVTKGRISQWINHPGNISLKKMIEYANALGMKVSVVAYEDNDAENKKGPVDSEIFKICWEKCGKPRDFWGLQDITYANIAYTTNYVSSISARTYDATLIHNRDTFLSEGITCPVYVSVEKSAINEINLKREELLPS